MIRHSSIRIRFIHTVLQTLAFSIPYLFHQVVLNESGIFRSGSFFPTVLLIPAPRRRIGLTLVPCIRHDDRLRKTYLT